MAQHFLLSAAARTLSLKAIFSEGEEAAYRRFCRLRWPETDGAPICPVCGCLEIFILSRRRRRASECAPFPRSGVPPPAPSSPRASFPSSTFFRRSACS